MDPVDSFGVWLRQRRLALRLTQRELAGMVGCSAVLIRKLEADERRPSSQVAQLLARHLAVPEAHHDLFVRVARAQRAAAVLSSPRAIAAQPPHAVMAALDLPASVSPLIGRDAELAVILRLIADGERLLVLVGPPGVGKTRLALAAAHALARAGATPVVFVQLAALEEEAPVIAAIARALDVRETAARSLRDQLKLALRARQLVMVLDNCEQLAGVAPVFSELLQAAPGLAMLCTSRARLRLDGERVVRLGPLTSDAAADLFVARAAAAAPEVELSEPQRSVVAAICQRLDHLPLAIELAAVRVRLFAPGVLLERLERVGLRELRDGRRDLPPHQQTLERSIDWSYRLLAAPEQRMFRLLGAFVGGFSAEAAAAVAGGSGEAALDLLGALVDHHLIWPGPGTDGAPRFNLLQTLRDYALASLDAAGERDDASRRHAEHFTALAERSRGELIGPRQLSWVRLLTSETDNLRAALVWSLGHWGAPDERGADVLLGERLASAIGHYWENYGTRVEARSWMTHALERSPGPDPLVRARLLRHLALVVHEQDENDLAIRLVEEGIALAALHGNASEAGQAHWTRAIIARKQHDHAGARAALAACEVRFRAADDPNGMAWVRFLEGLLAMDSGDAERADDLLGEAVRLFEQVGNRESAHWTHVNLGQNARFRGELAAAERHYRIALATMRAFGSRGLAATILAFLGHCLLELGEEGRALAIYAEALEELRLAGNRRHTADCFDGLAVILARRGQAEVSAQLIGAASAVREAICVPLAPAERPIAERRAAEVRQALGRAAFEREWERGRVLGEDAAYDAAHTALALLTA